jgi:FtsP/CotA-like multicopper oxidase with cupredoxin domain
MGKGPRAKCMALVAFAGLAFFQLHAQALPHRPCQRPAAASAVPEPEDLHSHNGELTVDMTIQNYAEADGSVRYCYTTADGKESPNLRLNPGDLLVLNLKNSLKDSPNKSAAAAHHHATTDADPCTSGIMSATSTNLHFHGLAIPAACHQDDVINTSIQPDDAPFQYRFRVPPNEPPGLYWYHPHIHGFSKVQVLGGASGALIVEGIERANKEVCRITRASDDHPRSGFSESRCAAV